MPFNDIEKKRIKQIVGGFCQERIPGHLRSQIKLHYEIRGFDVKIVESKSNIVRNHEWVERPVARMKYDPMTIKWELYWRRSSGKWMKYPGFKPTNRLRSLIDEIKEDRFRVFWG